MKTTCYFSNCTRRVALIGDCRFCKSKFCLKHRLPEEHSCQKMEDCRKNAFNINEENVMKGKCVPEKVKKLIF